jgi:hypothetical protein
MHLQLLTAACRQTVVNWCANYMYLVRCVMGGSGCGNARCCIYGCFQEASHESMCTAGSFSMHASHC